MGDEKLKKSNIKPSAPPNRIHEFSQYAFAGFVGGACAVAFCALVLYVFPGVTSLLIGGLGAYYYLWLLGPLLLAPVVAMFTAMPVKSFTHLPDTDQSIEAAAVFLFSIAAASVFLFMGVSIFLMNAFFLAVPTTSTIIVGVVCSGVGALCLVGNTIACIQERFSQKKRLYQGFEPIIDQDRAREEERYTVFDFMSDLRDVVVIDLLHLRDNSSRAFSDEKREEETLTVFDFMSDLRDIILIEVLHFRDDSSSAFSSFSQSERPKPPPS